MASIIVRSFILLPQSKSEGWDLDSLRANTALDTKAV